MPASSGGGNGTWKNWIIGILCSLVGWLGSSVWMDQKSNYIRIEGDFKSLTMSLADIKGDLNYVKNMVEDTRDRVKRLEDSQKE